MAAEFLAALLLFGCGPSTETDLVTLPALSFLPPGLTGGEIGDEQVERQIGHSVWAVVRAQSGLSASGSSILGSAVAVSGDTLLASCDVADRATPLAVLRRSTYRPVRIEAAQRLAQLCELRPGSVGLRTVAGYRPFADVPVGEPVLAVVSRSSRTFSLVRGSIVGKGGADDPFLETSLNLPPGTRSAALFDQSGHLVGFGSAGPGSDALLLAVPIVPDAAPWLAPVHSQRTPTESMAEPVQQTAR